MKTRLKRKTIALALPSLGQQRLSDMRRGWCPFQFRETVIPETVKGWSVPTLA